MVGYVNVNACPVLRHCVPAKLIAAAADAGDAGDAGGDGDGEGDGDGDGDGDGHTANERSAL
jgi:hypothetical protein